MSRVAIKLSPSKRGGFFARKRIPEDVRADYARLHGAGWEERFISKPNTPLATVRREAHEWAAEVNRRIENIRAHQKGDGQNLSREQARALSGEWYHWFTVRQLAKGRTVEHWEDHRDEIASTILDFVAPHAGNANDPDVDETIEHSDAAKAAVRPMLADWGETSTFLATKRLKLDAASYDVFLDWLYGDFAAALRLLIRRADGDYAPDRYAERLPKPAAIGLGAWDLFSRWVASAKPARSTVDRWRAVFLDLKRHFGERNVATITFDEAREWANGLITKGRGARTVADVWLSAARTVCAWSVTQRLISANPFADVSIVVPKVAKHRESSAFTPEEAAVILHAAMAVEVTASPFSAAKRWVPFLCAYSGARVGEITQLRAEDVFARDGTHALRLTPDAGTIKTRVARIVPLHEHIVAQGFLEFVASRKGALFYNAVVGEISDDDATNPIRPRAVKARERLAEWVRGLGLTDTELRPNHAWRHTFKQVADRHEITERMSDYITGHRQASVGRAYGAPTLPDMAEALKRFPRYST
jgi:integrase